MLAGTRVIAPRVAYFELYILGTGQRVYISFFCVGRTRVRTPNYRIAGYEPIMQVRDPECQ